MSGTSLTMIGQELSDVLKYWAAKEKGTDKEKGWPALAKMVKQYFAAPAGAGRAEVEFVPADE